MKEIEIPDYEKVIEATDPDVGLHCFIAIHDTTLGPAMGGTRIYPYSSREKALDDVLRLAKGMTYKSAVVENGLGGGKSVIIADPKKDKTEKLLLAFADVINTFQGRYIAAEDVGSTIADMVVLRKKTPYIAALPTKTSSGDPSRFTAWGVYQGNHAVTQLLWGKASVRKKKIAIQGLGSVGSKLARLLFWEGAELIFSDIDKERVEAVALKYGAKVVDPEEIIGVDCDIFAPCALGGILNEETIPKLKCRAVAGAANNQLLHPEDGRRLMEKGILYAPDYIINAGGIINAAAEFDPEGYDPKASRNKVNHIYDTLIYVLMRSHREKIPTNEIADHLAENNLKLQKGKRTTAIKFETS